MPTLFGRTGRAAARRISDVLRAETVGGLLLLGAAALALIWANSPWSGAYTELSGWRFGPAALHLDLTLAQWTSDGLLAIFFFVAALELKREFVGGDLRRSILPVAAAAGGMLVPALVYIAVNATRDGGDLAGWAVPMATDIAFALAVLALAGGSLPVALRGFLLTLAVVDDLLAILIIALVLTDGLSLGLLALALVPLAGFAVLVRRGRVARWFLLPLALATWALVHASGVHATIAGVLLAFVVPAAAGARYEHRWRPVSAGVAAPVFAFFAAGVSVSAAGGIGTIFGDPITIGIVAGLVVGKTVGIAGAAWLVQRFTRAELDEGLGWWEVVGLGLLGGVGLTVSLLLAELAFGAGTVQDAHARAGVLIGSVLAATAASVLLRVRSYWVTSRSPAGPGRRRRPDA